MSSTELESGHDAAMIEETMERHLGIEGMNTENKVKFIRRMGVREDTH